MTHASKLDKELLNTALNHVWSWYEMSLGHRLQVANYILLLLLANVAGYVTALQAKLHVVAGFIGIFAALLSAASAIVVKRTRERIKAAAIPLKAIQARLADELQLLELKMVEYIEPTDSRWWTKNRLAKVLFFVVILTFVAASSYAFAQ